MHEDEVLFTEFFNQKLKERGLTLKHLSDTTGIAMKHLENFSHGRFEHLPSAPYVHGYFVRLGTILGFDPDEWWSRIKEENTVHRSGSSDRMPDNRFSRLRGKALMWGGILIALAGLYVALRFTTIIGEPRLTLTAPERQVSSFSSTVTESILVLEGNVRNGDILTVNGTSVLLESNGSFKTEIRLSPGPNNVELRAKKFLGREDVLNREVYYDNSQVIVPVPITTPTTSTTTSATGTPVQ